jgi:hypothetical protein
LSIRLVSIRIAIVEGYFNLKNNNFENLGIGDLVKKIGTHDQGRFAVITDIAMEEYYNYNFWIRVVYADDIGGYEWVRREGIQVLNKCR